MERAAFKMRVKPGCEAEYQRRHDEIWPELEQLLSDAGIYDYSIFLDEQTGVLFALQKRKEGHRADRLAEEALMRRWWEYMSDLMDVNPDNSPVCIPLKEVFHMD